MPVLSWPEDASRLSAHVAAGGVFAYPTEAVFGLGGHPASPAAVAAVLRLKSGRDVRQGLLLVAGSPSHAAGFVTDLPDADWQAMRAAQVECPTTFLLPAGERLCEGVAVDGKVGLRLSQHALVVALTDAWQHPLLSTSANPHGAPAARSVAEVLAYFPDMWVVDGAVGTAVRASRIVDWESGKIIRF